MKKDGKQYETGDQGTDELIDQLVARTGHSETKELVREILTSAVKLGRESDDSADLRLANVALKEIRHSCKVFAPYRTTKKVIVFGSARSQPGSPEYTMAEAFSRKMSEMGYMITTGGGPGVMEAGNKGACEEMDFALNIRLPFEQKHNPFVDENDRLINYKYFFTRKLFFVKETDVTAVFPGGFGTLDEGFEMLTLVQTGKSKPRPIILMEPEGYTYWHDCMHFIDTQLLKGGFISTPDKNLYTIAHSVEEAVACVESFFRVYHSIRYDGAMTILRLKSELPEDKLRKLNSAFADIVTEGEIRPVEPTPKEVLDGKFIDLPRIGFIFNRREFGRLYELIKMINEE